jgi:hypothetical protein
MIHYAPTDHLEMSFRIIRSFDFPINYLSMHYYLVFFVVYNSDFHLQQVVLAGDCLHSIKLIIFAHSITAVFSF